MIVPEGFTKYGSVKFRVLCTALFNTLSKNLSF